MSDAKCKDSVDHEDCSFERYCERISEMGRQYCFQFLERSLASINLSMLVLSLVMVFEATLVGPHLCILTNHAFIKSNLVQILLALAGNMMFVLSLVLGVVAMGKLRVPIPLLGHIIDAVSEGDLIIEWVAREFSFLRKVLDYTQIAKAQTCLSHGFALSGSVGLAGSFASGILVIGDASAAANAVAALTAMLMIYILINRAVRVYKMLFCGTESVYKVEHDGLKLRFSTSSIDDLIEKYRNELTDVLDGRDNCEDGLS